LPIRDDEHEHEHSQIPELHVKEEVDDFEPVTASPSKSLHNEKAPSAATIAQAEVSPIHILEAEAVKSNAPPLAQQSSSMKNEAPSEGSAV
jgi:hypothetical protein